MSDDREAAKALLHKALHDLDVRITGLAGECHCNLVAEVALDALAPAFAAAEQRGRVLGHQEAVKKLAERSHELRSLAEDALDRQNDGDLDAERHKLRFLAQAVAIEQFAADLAASLTTPEATK